VERGTIVEARVPLTTPSLHRELKESMTDIMEKSPSHNMMKDPVATKVSILTLLRLSIGHLGTEPPTEEEEHLVEGIFKLRDSLHEVLGKENSTMIVSMVAITQMLEDVLCHYEDDMPDVLTAIITKLTLHGTQHMDLKDNPPREMEFLGTIH
jgi:hypothetical protein